MLLGRRDSTSASVDDANRDIPSPAMDVNLLVSAFQNQGLSPRDMVALSGTHTHATAHSIAIRELHDLHEVNELLHNCY